MEIGILCSYGIQTIDDNLQNLIHQMAQFPGKGTFLNDIQSWAKVIGLCLALGVGSYECWMMMLGRRGMDVMKILHIVIISICISMANWICTAAREPGEALAESAHNLALQSNTEIENKEKQIDNLQKDYLDKLNELLTNAKLQETTEEKNAHQHISVPGMFDLDVTELINNTKFRIKKEALALETKITQWIGIIIRFIGEVIFQIAYYGILVSQNIFMTILEVFCPLAFALSLAPPFRSAWSQWLSKFLSLSLWAFLVYVILHYVNYIIIYNLDMDIKNFQTLINDTKNLGDFAWETVGTIGMQGLGTTCMYVVGLLVGVYCLRFVPEVASWLIPGGVSSGAGGMAGASAGMAINASKSAATGAINLTTGAVGAVGTQAAKNLNGTALTSAKV